MESTVQALCAARQRPSGGGTKAPTIGKRFQKFAIPSTENHHGITRCYYDSQTQQEFISGVILFDETIRQKTRNGIPMQTAASWASFPGIKVDEGTVHWPILRRKNPQKFRWPSRTAHRYRGLGARFTKWRAVIAIEHSHARACLKTNAAALALFAGLSRRPGLVPIVEPGSSDGWQHTIARCEDVTTDVRRVFDALADHRGARANTSKREWYYPAPSVWASRCGGGGRDDLAVFASHHCLPHSRESCFFRAGNLTKQRRSD